MCNVIISYKRMDFMELILTSIIAYLFIINLLAIFIVYHDKNAARNHQWRVNESLLFSISIMGGAIGMYLSMKRIRHKTKHKRFMIGLPVIILIHSIVIAYILSTQDISFILNKI